MFAYRTPGVRFEWLDTPPPTILPVRTDIAGFVGIAERGPLHMPVKVESWTQFASTFGGFSPQGYLAYAVEGFFANGGQTCWVVRVADPETAAAATLVLRAVPTPEIASSEEPVLRLTAATPIVWSPEPGPDAATQAQMRRWPPASWRASPGVWGQNITVTVLRTDDERFSLILRLPSGEQEQWRDLTMALASLDLLDTSNQPALRLIADQADLWHVDVTVTVRQHSDPHRFDLTIQASDGPTEQWGDLTLQSNDDRDVEKILNAPQSGSKLVVARTLNVQPDAQPDAPRQLRGTVRLMKPEPRYIRTILNDLEAGSRLVAADHLRSTLRFPHNTPRPWASNLTGGVARLTGGQDGLAPSAHLQDDTGRAVLHLIAAGRLNLDDEIKVVVKTSGDAFSLEVQQPANKQTESWPRLSMQPWPDAERRQPNPAYVETVLNDPQSGSKLVAARVLQTATDGSANLPVSVTVSLRGGLDLEHFREGLDALAEKDEVGILAMPDIMPKPYRQPRTERRPVPCDVEVSEPSLPPAPVRMPEFAPAFSTAQITELQNRMVGQCEHLKDRVAVLDAPRPNGQDLPPARVLDWRIRFDTRYAALYYPWLRVPDPLELDGLLVDLPPSGHIAGLYARLDRAVGVHKPPANEVLANVQDVTTPLDDVLHGLLNERSVNAIRAYSGRGLRVAGARTLSSDPDWRYINVRRLLIMIEEAIDEQTQWVVFEPNNPELWREVDRVVRSFLDGLWQRGMLDGATAAEAYSVTCDATTNPPVETETGRLICRIGVQPPWPAEFVVVRIGKTERGTEIIETAATGLPGGR